MNKLSAMKAFVAVVEKKNFSAAAKELNTTQASISKKVAALEQNLSVKLLNRNNRKHSLTDIGQEYYQKCRLIIEEINEAEEQAREQLHSPRGRIRVTAPIPFCHRILAPLLPKFYNLYPNVDLQLILSNSNEDLIGSGFDVAIRASRHFVDSSLIAQHLCDNFMYLVASPEYLLKHGVPQSPEDLIEHNFIIYSMFQEGQQLNLINHTHIDSVRVSSNFSSNNGDTNLMAALVGIGITELPPWMVNQYLKTGELQRVLPKYKGDNVPFKLLYPSRRYMPSHIHCFIEFIKTELKALTEQGKFGS